MTHVLSLRLKPISIQFYDGSDCGVNSQFSAKIEHGCTVYKSGILKSSKEKYLSLSNIMWTEFLITDQDFHTNINIFLVSLDQNSVKSAAERGKQNEKAFFGLKQFISCLPLEELLCIPVNKKKKFCFPILKEGQIQGEAEFKMIIKQSNSSRQSPKGILKERHSRKNALQAVPMETAKAVTHQKKIIKPILSETSIEIRPEMFIKKSRMPSPEIVTDFDSKLLQDQLVRTYSDQNKKQKNNFENQNESSNNMDLLSKFQLINRKFQLAQLGDQLNKNHQHASVWQQEQQNLEPKTVQKQRQNYLQYGVIIQQTEEQDCSDHDFNQYDI